VSHQRNGEGQRAWWYQVCYNDLMTTRTKKLFERVESWPEEDLEKLEVAAAQIEAWRNGEYYATDEELRAIDEATAELDRGEVATDEEVRAAFAKF
jgi:hypothetical protein